MFEINYSQLIQYEILEKLVTLMNGPYGWMLKPLEGLLTAIQKKLFMVPQPKRWRVIEGLPPKIRSCIFLRLQLQTSGTIIQTFGAKTWICILILFLGLNEWRQRWRHHLWFLKQNWSKTWTPWRWSRRRKFSTKNWRSRCRSGGIWTPKASGYPEGRGPPFSNGREPFARPGPVTFPGMFWGILVGGS